MKRRALMGMALILTISACAESEGRQTNCWSSPSNATTRSNSAHKAADHVERLAGNAGQDLAFVSRAGHCDQWIEVPGFE